MATGSFARAAEEDSVKRPNCYCPALYRQPTPHRCLQPTPRQQAYPLIVEVQGPCPTPPCRPSDGLYVYYSSLARRQQCRPAGKTPCFIGRQRCGTSNSQPCRVPTVSAGGEQASPRRNYARSIRGLSELFDSLLRRRKATAPARPAPNSESVKGSGMVLTVSEKGCPTTSAPTMRLNR